MHPFFRSAFALLLIAPQFARAQASLPPGFVDASAVVDGLVVDMRYFGSDNFVGQRIDGYERPRCVLSAPAANALAAVQRGHVDRPRRRTSGRRNLARDAVAFDREILLSAD